MLTRFSQRIEMSARRQAAARGFGIDGAGCGTVALHVWGAHLVRHYARDEGSPTRIENEKLLS